MCIKLLISEPDVTLIYLDLLASIRAHFDVYIELGGVKEQITRTPSSNNNMINNICVGSENNGKHPLSFSACL